MLFINLGILLIGFVALIKGADFFVDGSAALAKSFGIPSVIIGLTIVALGTSAPELAVSTSAALQGSNEIALSNVVGSNIFNTLVVLGVCAIIHPVSVEKVILKRDFPFTIFGSVFLLLASGFLAVLGTNHATLANELSATFGGALHTGAMDMNVGVVSRIAGIALIAMFVAYIVRLIHVSKDSTEEEVSEENGQSVAKSLVMIVFGLAMIVAGGQAVVNSAKFIAAAAGMTGLAVGNVVGSNIFNMMFILGVPAMIHPVVVNMASMFDLIILIGISLMAFLFCANDGKIERNEGLVMVAVYAADMAFAILR